MAISSPSDGYSTNSRSIQIEGTCEDNTNLNLSGDFEGTPTISCLNGAFSLPLTLTANDGIKSITVNQVDEANNETTVSLNINLDTLVPVVSFNSPVDQVFVNNETVPVMGSCENGFNVTLTGDVINQVTVSCSGSTFTASVDLTNNDGVKTITAVQVDAATNSGDNSITVNLDTTPPEVRFTSPVSGFRTKLKNIDLIGSCEIGLGVKFTGDIESELTAPCFVGTFTASLSLNSGDGVKNITVTQTDDVGNWESESIAVTLDTTPPEVGFTSPNDSDFVGNTSIQLSGNCEIGLTVIFSGDIDGSPTTSCSSGDFLATINLTSGDGVKNITAAQVR